MMPDLKQTHDLLKKHFKIKGAYEIDPATGLVNVHGDISVTDDWRVLPIILLPVHFHHVTGDFICDDQRLISLKGAPRVVDGDFFCTNNKLQSLKGAPERVGGTFNCYNNKITSLKGAPTHVGDDFHCDWNQLTSLKGAPNHVGGNFYADGNPLTSLEGVPTHVGFRLEVPWDPDLPLLRLLAYKQVHALNAPDQVQHIMMKYADEGKHAALKAALELKEAGYPEHAKW